jgi:hypothetical protein
MTQAPAGGPAPEILRADPGRRRTAILIVFLALVLGTIGIGWGLPALQQWVWSDTGLGRVSRARTVCLAFGGVIVLTAAAVIGSGFRMARFGRTAVLSQRFPPPGMPVFRDTPQASGRPAIILGRLYRGTGFLIAGLGAALLVLGGYAVVLLWP